MTPLLLAALPTWQGSAAPARRSGRWLVGALGLWLLLPDAVALRQDARRLARRHCRRPVRLRPAAAWATGLDQGVFWLLAVVTLGAAVATIASQSPVYSAIWFALSLLGTAGLFLFQGAQFLGVATIVVYAGAIVVTFLFVIMLAQPEGHSAYDRLSWGGLPKVLGVVTAGAAGRHPDVHARPPEGRSAQPLPGRRHCTGPSGSARPRRHPGREAHGQSRPASVQPST